MHHASTSSPATDTRVIQTGSLILLQGTVGLTIFARNVRGAGGNWRAPHHTCSDVALLGELALAAGGVLFLDEVLEFRRRTLHLLFRTWDSAAPAFRPTLIAGLRLPHGQGLPEPTTADAWWRRLVSLSEIFPMIDDHVVVEPATRHRELKIC